MNKLNKRINKFNRRSTLITNNFQIKYRQRLKLSNSISIFK